MGTLSVCPHLEGQNPKEIRKQFRNKKNTGRFVVRFERIHNFNAYPHGKKGGAKTNGEWDSSSSLRGS